jgi:rubredoxin
MGTHYSILFMETDIDCFECLVCGYIYDPEAGDPVGGIPSGVKFLSLPDDWLCPECSAGKDEFALVEL